MLSADNVLYCFTDVYHRSWTTKWPNMILNGCSSVPVGASLDVKAKLKSYNTASLCIARTPSKVAAFSSIKSSCVLQQELKYCSPKGVCVSDSYGFL